MDVHRVHIYRRRNIHEIAKWGRHMMLDVNALQSAVVIVCVCHIFQRECY